MILEVMEVKWRSKRGRIDTAMAYSKNMGKNRVVCKKDPQLVENCDRQTPLKVLWVERHLFLKGCMAGAVADKLMRLRNSERSKYY